MRSRAVDRLVVLLAALICLVFVGGLRDTPLRVLSSSAGLDVDSEPRDGALRVRVEDEAHRPIAGASARVFLLKDKFAYFEGEAASDAQGELGFTELLHGETWVMVYAEGRTRGSSRLVIGPGGRELTVTLRPASRLDVRVVDDKGRPFEGADVYVSAADPLPFAARTGASGAVAFDRLGPGPYGLRVRARGYDDVLRDNIAPEQSPVRIRLQRLAALVVSVVDAGGAPVPHAEIVAVGPGLWPARKTAADLSGRARITGLRAGSYDLQARDGGRVSPTEIAVALSEGEAKDVRLVLGEGRLLAVTVTDGDAEDAPPVEGASVTVADGGLSSFPLQGVTGKDGVVRVGPVSLGLATVQARAPGFVGAAVLVGAEATEVRVPLRRGGTLIGDVRDARGFPIAGATLEVIGTDLDGMPIADASDLTAFRDQHFALTLGGPMALIPAGELGVMPGPIPDLPHEGSAMLVAPGPGPIADARPLALPAAEPWVTRGDGSFRVGPISPGKVQAIVRHPDYVETLSAMVSLAPGGEAELHIVMQRGGTLEGRVVEEDDTPVSGARVELAAMKGSLERVVYAADDGTFAFAAVPSDVLLSVARREDPASVVLRQRVSVKEDERREVILVLAKRRDAVSVRVNDDRGYPISRVELHVISLDAKVPLLRTVFTDEAGEVSVPDAAGLPLRITLSAPTKAPKVEVLEDAPTELTLTMSEGIVARGTVTARGGRDRLAGASVTLYARTGARHATTDAEGEFVFKDVAEGSARLSATHPDYARGEATVAITDGGKLEADLGAVELAQAGEVAGRVVDELGEPVAGARVSYGTVPSFLPLGPLPPGIVAADAEGRFTLGNVPEGKVTLEAYVAERGRATADAQIRADRTTEDVTITLPPAGPLSALGGAGSLAVTLSEGSEGGRTVVRFEMVPPGGEAERAMIQPGDALYAINNKPIRTIEQARAALSGPLSEDVILTVGSGKETWLTRVRRERVRR